MDFPNIIKVLRPEHWSKNILILLGFFLAALQSGFKIDIHSIFYVSILLFSFCIISSGNYILNDLVDRNFDKHHPLKKNRLITKNILSKNKSISLMLVFWIAGFLAVLLFLERIHLLFAGLFLISAILYNMKPFRFKAFAILDVLTESVNSPIRVYAGWSILSSHAINIWILVFTYFYTCTLMNSKRLAEFQFIPQRIIKSYREVFRFYSKNKLILLFYLYLALTMLSLIILAFEFRPLFIIPSILIYIQLLWFHKLALRGSSVAQKPVYVYKNRLFLIYSVIILLLALIILVR